MKPHSVGQYKLIRQYGEYEKGTIFTAIYTGELHTVVYIGPNEDLYIPTNVLEKVNNKKES